MEEGFILSNKHRRAIFDELVAGETNLDRIIKKQRIIRLAAERVIKEFVDGGIIEQKGNQIKFTSEGEKLVERIGK
jgi:predicted transcriptional regulator